MIIGISGKIGSGKDTVATMIQYHCYNDRLVKQGLRPLPSFGKFETTYADNTFEIVKFADVLKDMVCLILNCTREQLEDREFKNKPLSQEWIRYGYADGFFKTSKGTIMNNEPCTKEQYEAHYRTNWQTAYKLEHTPRTILQLLGTQCGRFVHPDIWVNALMNKYKAPIIGYDRDEIIGKYPIYDSLPNWIISDVRFPNEADAVKERNGILIRLTRFTKEDNHESEIALDDYDFDYTVDNSDGNLETLCHNIKNILITENIISNY